MLLPFSPDIFSKIFINYLMLKIQINNIHPKIRKTLQDEGLRFSQGLLTKLSITRTNFQESTDDSKRTFKFSASQKVLSINRENSP